MEARRKRALRSGLAVLAFISLGLPDGLLGVAWPSIRVSFGLSLDALGPLLVVTTTGYVLSSIACGRLLRGMSVGVLLASSCLSTSASLLGYASAPRWGWMVALGSLAGLGAGAIDSALNTYVSIHHGPRFSNWLHACYGVGAASGPLIMSATLTAGLAWPWGYTIVGSAQLLLAGAFAASVHLWPVSATTATADTASAPLRDTIRLPATWLGMMAFFIYTGLEATTGAWAYSHFTVGRGFPMEAVGAWVSLYWGGLTAGRLLFGFVVAFAPLRSLLFGCLSAILVGAGLVALGAGPGASLSALVLLGLASGPIFPSMIAATPARLGAAHAPNAVGLQIAAAALGQASLPALAGILAGRMGLGILGPFLLGGAAALMVTYAILSSGRETAAQDSSREASEVPGLRAPRESDEAF